MSFDVAFSGNPMLGAGSTPGNIKLGLDLMTGKAYFGNGQEWTAVQQSASGSIPSQTGNAGSFLTTNGTSASWSNFVDGGTY